MRHTPVVLCLIGLLAPCLQAQAPASRPAASQSVLVLPFVSPPGQQFDWIGKGIQQNLIAELSPDLRGTIVSPAGAQPTEDTTAALKAARDAKAAAVVFGSAQVIGKQIRLTGQVLDVAGGKSLGTLKATGALDDLFRLQDLLAAQAVQALPRQLLNLRGMAAAQQSARPQIYQLPGDQPAPFPNYTQTGSAYPSSIYDYEAPAPPYSPYSYSYPYRFYFPYYHYFSYGSGVHADGLFPFPLGSFRNFDEHRRSEPRPHLRADREERR